MATAKGQVNKLVALQGRQLLKAAEVRDSWRLPGLDERLSK